MIDVSSWIEVFGRLHPLVLHLPIGFIAALVALELVTLLRRATIAELTPAISVFVWLAAGAALIAALTGYTLGGEDGYDEARVTTHFRLGIGVAIGTCALVLVHARGSRTTYRMVLFVTAGVLAAAGHFGSVLTRGEGFLTQPLRATTRADEQARPADPAAIAALPFATTPADVPTRSTYRDVIAPIFAARCAACHGETKKKGGLSLTSPAAISAGGSDGPVLVPGQPEKSELVRRLHLPLDDEDHMPPAGKAQPTPAEIAAIEAWIAARAPIEGVVSAVEASAPARATSAARPSERAPAPAPADPAALAALRRELVHVAPLATDTPLLEVDFSAVGQATTDTLVTRLLEPVREQVARLSLSRCAITDGVLTTVARIPHLQRLDLSSTPVTDAGLAALADHPRLAELVLVRARLSDAAVDSLLRMPALERIYVWQSGLSAGAVARLRRERPALAVDAGDVLGPPALETEPEVHVAPAGATATAIEPARTPSSLAPANTLCPVSGQPVDAAYSIVFRGRVIGFCCAKCPTKFWADPEAYASKVE